MKFKHYAKTGKLYKTNGITWMYDWSKGIYENFDWYVELLHPVPLGLH